MTKSEVRLINVYSVNPENQEKLIQILEEGVHSIMVHQEGYLGSTILRSLDGKSVVVYAHWKEAKNIAAVFQKPENQSYIKRIQEIATAAPGIYEECSSHRMEK